MATIDNIKITGNATPLAKGPCDACGTKDSARWWAADSAEKAAALFGHAKLCDACHARGRAALDRLSRAGLRLSMDALEGMVGRLEIGLAKGIPGMLQGPEMARAANRAATPEVPTREQVQRALEGRDVFPYDKLGPALVDRIRVQLGATGENVLIRRDADAWHVEVRVRDRWAALDFTGKEATQAIADNGLSAYIDRLMTKLCTRLYPPPDREREAADAEHRAMWASTFVERPRPNAPNPSMDSIERAAELAERVAAEGMAPADAARAAEYIREAAARRMAQPFKPTVTGVLVHADGGPCHGSPVVRGMCSGCKLPPDTASCELWSPQELAAHRAGLAGTAAAPTIEARLAALEAAVFEAGPAFRGTHDATHRKLDQRVAHLERGHATLQDRIGELRGRATALEDAVLEGAVHVPRQVRAGSNVEVTIEDPDRFLHGTVHAFQDAEKLGRRRAEQRAHERQLQSAQARAATAEEERDQARLRAIAAEHRAMEAEARLGVIASNAADACEHGEELDKLTGVQLEAEGLLRDVYRAETPAGPEPDEVYRERVRNRCRRRRGANRSDVTPGNVAADREEDRRRTHAAAGETLEAIAARYGLRRATAFVDGADRKEPDGALRERVFRVIGPKP